MANALDRIPEAVPEAPALSPRARLAEMFGAHFDFVCRAVRRFGVPADAMDDAAQEVFLVASRKLDKIEPGKEKAFLFGTAMRVAADTRRARDRRRIAADATIEHTPSSQPPQDALVDRKRARELLQRVIDSLDEAVRPVFVLFELEGMTAASIADLLEIPPGTVASRLRRARRQFKEHVRRLEREGKVDDE